MSDYVSGNCFWSYDTRGLGPKSWVLTLDYATYATKKKIMTMFNQLTSL